MMTTTTLKTIIDGEIGSGAIRPGGAMSLTTLAGTLVTRALLHHEGGMALRGALLRALDDHELRDDNVATAERLADAIERAELAR